jgi:hypothetical protein
VVYEIALRYPDRERVVLSQTPLDVGATVQLAGRRWIVLESVGGENGRVRFICGLVEDGRTRQVG